MANQTARQLGEKGSEMHQVLSRAMAQVDLGEAARPLMPAVRIPEDRAFRVCQSVIHEWRGMRYVGSSSSLWDTEDPQTLALLVERHHDYPDGDWFGQSITDR